MPNRPAGRAGATCPGDHGVDASLGSVPTSHPRRRSGSYPPTWRWALLVGVYRFGAGINPLPFASRDVATLRECLLRNPSSGYADERIIMLTSESDSLPTVSRILGSLDLMRSRIGSGDALLVFVSTHGFEAEGEPYLAPYGASLNTPPGKMLRLRTMLAALNRIECVQQVLLLDACHSGLDHSLPMWSNASHSILKAPARNQFIISGTVADGVSYEDEGLGSAVLTHFLIEALTSPDADFDYDGVLSAQEGFSFAEQRVRAWAAEKGVVQEPIHYSQGSLRPTLVTVDRTAGAGDLAERVGTIEYTYRVQGNASTGYKIFVSMNPRGIPHRNVKVRIAMAYPDGRIEMRFRPLHPHLKLDVATLDSPVPPVRLELQDCLYDASTGREVAKIRIVGGRVD